MEIEEVIEEYSNMLFKICLVITCNSYDAEDAMQETFIRYINKSPTFNDKEHEKAWLIRVATNICKDMCRFKANHKHVNIDDLEGYYKNDENGITLVTIMQLPTKYKIVLILHYIEGYKVNEIASIVGCSPSAVKKRLQRGRELLKYEYGKES